MLAPTPVPARVPANPRLLSSVGALTSGHLGYALLQWLLLMVVARAMGPGPVGDLTLSLSVTAPIFLLAGLELRLLMLTDPRLEARLAGYVRIRAWSGALAIAASFGAAALVLPPRGALVVCLLVALCKYVESWGDLASAVYQRRNMLWRLLLSQTARGVLALGAIAIAAGLGLGLAPGVALWLALWCAFVLAVDGPALRSAHRPAGLGVAAAADHSHFVRTTILAGAALSAASFLNSMAANLPRLWLARHSSIEGLGEFGFVTYVIGAASILLGAAFTGIAPALVEPRQGRRRTRLILLGVTAAAALASGVALFVHWQARPLIELLAGPAFRGSAEILRIAIWALPFYAVATAGNTLAVAERRGRQQVVAYVVTLAATGAVLLLHGGPSPAVIAAHAVVLGSAVQAAAVMTGLAVGGSTERA